MEYFSREVNVSCDFSLHYIKIHFISSPYYSYGMKYKCCDSHLPNPKNPAFPLVLKPVGKRRKSKN